jgi:hypothetical protein
LKKAAILIFFAISSRLACQTGGQSVYSFLDIPMTARAAGLGGSNMPVWGDDINLVYSNPALLNPSMHRQAALNYCNYVGDLNLWYLGYAHKLKNIGTGAFSMQAFDYGKFSGYDEFGQKTTDFRASDYSMNLAMARPFADSMFNVGLAVKTIISQYETYSSVGNAIDFGISYHNKKDLTMSILAKNIGYVWKTYQTGTGGARDLPYNWQVGFSKKVEKAPFRIIVIYDQFFRWRLRYISPLDTANKTTTLGSDVSQRDSTGFQKFSAAFGPRADNFMRHLILGTEIYFGKNFIVRVGYNYRRQKEMTLTERRGMNAFSFGFTMRIKRFAFSYSFAKMAFPGNSNLLGLTFSW